MVTRGKCPICYTETQNSVNKHPTYTSFVELILWAKNEIKMDLFISNCAFSLHQDTKIKPIPVPGNIQHVTWFKRGGGGLASKRRERSERSSALPGVWQGIPLPVRAQWKPVQLCSPIYLKEILYLVCIIERTSPGLVVNLGWKVPPQWPETSLPFIHQ